MTMRFKVLLFAAVAVGLVGAMGGILLLAAAKSGSSRDLSIAFEEQLDLYHQLESETVEALGGLMRVDVSSGDIRAVLSAQQTQAEARLERMQANLDAIQALGGQVGEAERQQLLQLRQTYPHWLEQTGAHLTSGPEHAPVDVAQLGASMTRFKQEVKPVLAQLEAARRAERELLKATSLQAIGRGRLMGMVLPVLALGAMLALAAAILLPMHRQLRALRQGAERLRQGDFSVELSADRRDELGVLAQAFNHMAGALRDNHTRLEDTVRQRTSELEEAHARLSESFKRLQRTQGRLLSLTRLATVGQIATDVGSEINNPLAYLLSNINYAYEELSRQDRPLSLKEQLEVLEALSEARQGAERVHLIARELKVLARPEEPG